MNNLQLFKNEQFGTIRTLVKDGEPWFVAKDVCEALEIQNVTQALERLDDDERSMFNIGRQGETNIVNEPGLYTLILGSRKPEAKAFKRWVTHDILPAIRKTGMYAAPGAVTNAMAELHAAMTAMEDMLRDMKQAIPKMPSLERVLRAKVNGNLDAYHLGSGNSFSRRLLDHEKIGRKITVYLIEEDMNTEELAAEFCVSANTMYRWRRGENAPAGRNLAKLCDLLGCDVSELLR